MFYTLYKTAFTCT